MTRWLAVALALFVTAMARSLADGYGVADESWFLQVVARARGDDVLYRDVFFGATPLSVYATAAVTGVIGTEIVAVKIVTNAAFAIAVAMAARLTAACGGSPATVWLIVATSFVLGRPYANPPYTAVAMAFFVAALVVTRAAVVDPDRASRGRVWLLAGALAGASVMSKQNVGLLAVGVMWLAAWWALGWREAVRTVAPAATGLAIVTVIVLLPVAASGGFAGLWEYGFAAKGGYVDIGAVSYVASLRGWLSDLASIRSADSAGRVVHGLVLILPLVTAAVALRRAAGVPRADRVVLAFAAAAVLTAFPRWDRFHMVYAVPVLLPALVALLRAGRSGPDTRRRITALGWAVGGAALIVSVGRPIAAFVDPAREISRATHFRGPVVDGARDRTLAEAARALALAAGNGPLFIVRMDAGFWYLRSGLANPTPFDYPAATSVGRAGEQWLIDRIALGMLPAVCLDDGPPGPLALTGFAAVVRERLEPGPDVGPCTVYRVSARRRTPD